MGIPVVVAAVWFGAPWLTILVAVLAVLGVRELYRLRPKGIPPLPAALGMIWAISLVVGAQGSSSLGSFLVISFIILAVGAIACLLWLIAYYTSGRPLTASLYLLAGPVYVGFLLAHSLALREIGSSIADSSHVGRVCMHPAHRIMQPIVASALMHPCTFMLSS